MRPVGLILLMLPLNSLAEGWEVSGLMRGQGIAAVSEEQEPSILKVNKRFELSRDLTKQIRLDLAYELELQRTSGETAVYQYPLTYRLQDKAEIHRSDDGKTLLLQNLDRFSLIYQTPDSRLLVGRQAIWFGVGNIANPTDVFLPFAFGVINPEYRLGVDAIHYVLSLGDLAEMAVGVLGGGDLHRDGHTKFLRFKAAIDSIDWEILGVHFFEANLVGFNLQYHAFGVGFFGEGARVQHQGSEYVRVNFGSSLMTEGEWVLRAEYHYNGAGEESFENYHLNDKKFAYQYGGVAFQGVDYGAVGLSKTLNPLWTLSIDGVRNLRDRSSMLSSTLIRSVSDNVMLTLGIITGCCGSTNREFQASPTQLFLNVTDYY